MNLVILLLLFFSFQTAFNFVGNKDTGKVWLESTQLPWKHAYDGLKMCLQFKFNTSSITVPHSSLNVYVIQSAENNFTVWSLKGYQGNHSYFGQVSWTLEQKIKVTQKSLKYTIHASFLLNVTVLIDYCNSLTLKLECVAGVERRGR